MDDNLNSFYNYISYYLEQYPVYSKEEERIMLVKIKNGDLEAKKEFINHNYRLVISICNKYHFERCDFSDLFQAGMIGLIEAIDKFDLNRNVVFSTYATSWITKEVLKVGYSSISVIASFKVQQEYHEYLNKKEKLLQLESSDLSLEEIAIKLGYTFERVCKFENLKCCESSLEYLYENCNNTKEDFIADKYYESDGIDAFEKVNLEMERLEFIKFLTEILDENELKIILMYFGFSDECKTFGEISKYIYSERTKSFVSRQNVERIYNKALRKIRERKKTFVEYGFLD